MAGARHRGHPRPDWARALTGRVLQRAAGCSTTPTARGRRAGGVPAARRCDHGPGGAQQSLARLSSRSGTGPGGRGRGWPTSSCARPMAELRGLPAFSGSTRRCTTPRTSTVHRRRHRGRDFVGARWTDRRPLATFRNSADREARELPRTRPVPFCRRKAAESGGSPTAPRK
jgi:hypothetical protein